MLAKISAIGIFIVCARAIVNMGPGQTYGKYLKMLLSILILLQLLQPMPGIFGKGNLLKGLSGEALLNQIVKGVDADVGFYGEALAGYEEQIAFITKYGIQKYGGICAEENTEDTGEEESGGGDVMEEKIQPISVKVEEWSVSWESGM